jgi:hypothetical protein
MMATGMMGKDLVVGCIKALLSNFLKGLMKMAETSIYATVLVLKKLDGRISVARPGAFPL